MKIIFFTLLKSSEWGGSENLWFKTAELALKDGHNILIIAEKTLNKEKIIHLKNNGAEVYFLENHLVNFSDRVFQFFNQAFAENKFLKKINERVDSFNPDLIVLNQPGCYDIAFNKTVSAFLSATKKKYTICFHSYIENEVLNPSESKLLNEILIRSSACFFVAKKQAQVILQQLKINSLNVEYIFNPLNLLSSSYIAFPQTEKVHFAMISSLDMNWKGQDVVLNILAKPRWIKENWSLEIFGDGRDFEKIDGLIKELQLTERVSLKGHAQDIREIWANHHILLMPSRVDAAPSVLLEAMICGRTAICTNIGFVADWITDDSTGFIAPDTKTFEEAMTKAWAKLASWEEMGRLAHQKVITTFPKKPERKFLDQIISYI